MADAVWWVGQRALLAEFSNVAELAAFRRQVTEQPLMGQRATVAASRTVLVEFRSRRDAKAAARQLRRTRQKPAAPEHTRDVEIRIHYDGDDLDGAAEAAGMSVQAFIERHSSLTWVGLYAASTPGLTACVPEELIRRKRPRRAEAMPPVPRRADERVETPAGSVAMAEEFSGAFPRSSSSRWQIIGRTDAVLWEPSSAQPALIRPGDRVRYLPQTEAITVRTPATYQQEPEVPGQAALEVLDPGVQTLVQDLGRYGFGDLGVPRSGAADVPAMRQANQLVGNDDAAAGFEVLYGGLELTARQTLVLAVTGAEAGAEVISPAPEDTSNMAVSGTGAPVDHGEEKAGSVRDVPARAPFWLFPGERFRLAAPTRGIRSYVAISGGVAAGRVLGSCAADTHTGLGPPQVHAGEHFALVGATSRFVGIADVAPTALPQNEEPTVLRFIPGPRHELFGAAGLQRLSSTLWNVSQDSNRVGLRIRAADGGPSVETRSEVAKQPAPPEPVLRGAIQIPHDGEPVLFLADHPVTAGHPVIGVVVREDLGLAAQLPPGADVRLQAVDPDSLQPVN